MQKDKYGMYLDLLGWNGEKLSPKAKALLPSLWAVKSGILEQDLGIVLNPKKKDKK